jgi:hypothetical protein
LPGNALLLRVARIGRHDFRAKQTLSRSKMVLTGTFSFRRCRSLSKKAHLQHASHFHWVGGTSCHRAILTRALVGQGQVQARE